ncbi:hypothetical protein B0I35DRAFT_481295 [Stachybotrys elegans]|uniref:DUF2891 family protein n=1 Tax=Stachybotrys elegans TaxID=80388 RepID=A0A8K0SLS2_9HYPO|nr:hypothetical protein B0I35DRAFT_481295 [Stachybotrys elegans]
MMISHIGRATAVAVLVLPLALGSPVPDLSSRIRLRSDAAWEEFQRARTGMLVELAEPIEDCWSRPSVFLPGYTSPMFQSCVDWHSSVHAAYSLYTITEASGNDRFKDIAEEVIHNDKVPAEIEYMTTARIGNITFFDIEVPYGMAWLFNLVMQRRQTMGNDGLRPLGDLAADELRAYLASLSDDDIKEMILIPAHENLSWAILHLSRWARYITDDGMRREIEQRFLSAALDSSLDQECPVENDSGSDYEEFFPPCLLRLSAVIQTWNGTAEALTSWVNERVPSNFNIPPVTEIEDPRTGHKFAINFSRAFALWYIYQATGNTAFRDNYAELITYQISRPDFWNIEAGYLASHFVPQFGVRAIEASREGENMVFRAE